MNRKDLEQMVKVLNIRMNRPTEVYTMKDGKYTANYGCFHIEGAYGGVRLSETVNGSAVKTHTGYLPKKDLARFIQGMLATLDAQQRAEVKI